MNGASIPVRCQHLTRVGGLPAPWIAAHSEAQTLAGVPLSRSRTAVFGSIDNQRRIQVLLKQLCQVCGQKLRDRAVYLVRPQDRLQGYAPEPALHVECSHYSLAVCPMLNGLKDHHRRSELNLRPLTRSGAAYGEPVPENNYKPGRGADHWDAWWVDLDDYCVRFDDSGTRVLGLDLRAVHPRRVRHVRDADASNGPDISGYLSLLDAMKSLFADPGHSDPGTAGSRTQQCPVHGRP